MSPTSHEVIPDPDRPGSWKVRFGVTDQSYVDPDDPRYIAFEYVQRITELLDAWAPEGERIRVLHIGGGGLTLPRYVAATRPTSAQIVLEPDAELTESVRRVVPLGKTSGIKVRPEDGRTGIAKIREVTQDVVIVDAFAGARVPAELGTAEFLAEAARVLAPGGMFVMNLTDQAPFAYAKRLLAGVGQQWPHLSVAAEPATWKGRRFGNLVVAAAAGTLPDTTRSMASAIFPQRRLAGKKLADWIGGAAPFTDADSMPSPEPPNLWR